MRKETIMEESVSSGAPIPLWHPVDPSLRCRLGYMLTPRTIARPTTPKQEEKSFREWEIIGAGQCGSIFAQVGREDIAKVCNKDFDASGLWNDWIQHQQIIQAIEQHRSRVPDIFIPQPLRYLVEGDITRFLTRHPGMEKTAATSYKVKLPAQMLIMERILPLPEETRKALIEFFCHVDMRQKALDTPTNKDCLIRVYLGRENHRGPSPKFFTLRNLCLYRNQLERIQLDVQSIAVTMARTMAIIHWAAGCDGRDIEFVLGSKKSRKHYDVDNLEELEYAESLGPEDLTSLDQYYPQQTQLFLLDFNQVSRIKFDKTGAEAAAIAFFENDPYCPRPHQRSNASEKLWNLFAREYLKMAEKIMGDDVDSETKSLPLVFLVAVSRLVRPPKEEVRQSEEDKSAERGRTEDLCTRN